MHEYSLAAALLDEVARVVISNGGGRVQEVHVELGPLSGIEPLLLADAFEQMKPATCAASARLLLKEVALLAECQRCGHRFEPDRFTFVCPACEGVDCRAVQGDGLILQRLVLHEADERT